jgi:hypothetical protein
MPAASALLCKGSEGGDANAQGAPSYCKHGQAYRAIAAQHLQCSNISVDDDYGKLAVF